MSSSFKVKIFHGALNTRTSNGTTIDKINNRRTVLEAVRVVDQCHGVDETFIESHCTPDDPIFGSQIAFSWTCRRMEDRWHAQTGVYLGRRPTYLTFTGECEETDLCVDTTIVKHLATCVKKSFFDDGDDGLRTDKGGRVRGMRDGRYFDVAEAHAAITGTDQKTPMESKSMDISAWKSSAALSKASVQTKKCRNCVELETDKLKPNIDSLKVEATLLSAGAVTGILWLSLISG